MSRSASSLIAALPVPSRLPLGFALVAAIAAADVLVYDARIGLGFALFLCAVAALAGASAPDRPTRRVVLFAALAQGAAIAPLLAQSNPLTVLIALVGTLSVSLWLRGVLCGVWSFRLAELGLQILFAPLRWCSLGMQLGSQFVRSSPRAAFVVWVAPVLLASGFVALFADANPLIARLFAAIDLVAVFEALFTDRVWAWAGTALLAAPFLHPAAPQAVQVRPLLNAIGSARSPRSEDARLRRRFSEADFAARCLLLFNAVFFVQTLADVVFLYGGAALPAGTSYAAYAHRGAYPLLATAILAGLFVVWTTRPDGPAATSQLVTRLVLLWIAQNVLLLVSSLVRLDLYVGAMGLTYWRLAAFIWMALTGVGFVLTVVRAVFGQSLGWLVASNAVALLAVLYVAGFVNWADVVARSQLARVDAGSCGVRRYVQSIGPAALPALIEHNRRLGRSAPDCGPYFTDPERFLRARLYDTLGPDGRFDPRSLTWRRSELEKVARTSYPAARAHPEIAR